MKITKQKLKLKAPENKYMAGIIEEMRENLTRMGVSGLSIDARYDVKSNTALCRFNFEGQNYEMKVSNQKDVKTNMYAICKRIEYKARMHLLDIEPFKISVSAYLMLENKSGSNDYAPPTETEKATEKDYIVLGISPLASTEQLLKHYKHMMKSFHPDNALSTGAKQEFEKRTAEINNAWNNVKKERGIR